MTVSTRVETVIHPVRDLEQAKKVYGALLGVEPVKDEPYYVGFDVDGYRLGLDPNGHRKGMTAPVVYWRVGNVEAALESLVAAGAEIRQEPTDVGGGKLIATVADADGNVTGLIQNP